MGRRRHARAERLAIDLDRGWAPRERTDGREVIPCTATHARRPADLQVLQPADERENKAMTMYDARDEPYGTDPWCAWLACWPASA